ncbi:MAG: SCO family protein [Methylotenera sp.]
MKKIFIFAILLMLSACSLAKTPVPFVATDITGADFAKTLTLTDHNGNKRNMTEFKGKAVVLFFGYTHCPDVCPTTMSDLKQAMKLLDKKADEVQVLFVTVDPQRDTQEVLAKFVPSFDKRFIGLWGSLQETAETLGNFKIYYSKVPGKGENDYSIDHSAGMYVFDKLGKVRLYMSYGQKPVDIVSDIKQLL